MQRVIFTSIYGLFILLGCIGCGGQSADMAGPSSPRSVFQLAAVERDYIDGAERNASTVLFHNPEGDRYEQWTADAFSRFHYDGNDRLVREDIEYVGIDVADSVLYLYDTQGRLTSKRYERVFADDRSQLYLTIAYAYDDNGHILSETHVAPYTTGANGEILAQETLLTTIDYGYAYKDGTQKELILIEKRALSDDGEIRVYFRYDQSNEKVDTVEYDWDNDFNIDAVMYVTHDPSGNREVAELYDYDMFGNESLKLTVFYTWAAIGSSPALLSTVSDSGLALGLGGGPYY